MNRPDNLLDYLEHGYALCGLERLDILYMNRAMSQWMGCGEDGDDGGIGDDDGDGNGNGDSGSNRSHLRDYIEQQYISRVEKSIQKSRGIRLKQVVKVGRDYLNFSCKPIEYNGQKVLLIQATIDLVYRQSELDKTIQKEIQLLEKENQDLIEINRLKSEFVANLSHEIRTPLHGIVATVSLLLEQVSDDHVKESLEIVRSSGDDLGKVVDQILDFSKTKERVSDLAISAVDINALLSKLSAQFKPQVRRC